MSISEPATKAEVAEIRISLDNLTVGLCAIAESVANLTNIVSDVHRLSTQPRADMLPALTELIEVMRAQTRVMLEHVAG